MYQRQGALYMPAHNGIGPMSAAFGGASLNPMPFAENPVIGVDQPWEAGQVQWLFRFDDAADPTKYVAYYGGAPAFTGPFRTGIARALKTQPQGPWVQDPSNPIINVGSFFMDSMVDSGGNRLMSFTDQTTQGTPIGLKTASLASPYSFTDYVGNPILTANGVDETEVSTGTLHEELDHTWALFYNFRYAPGFVLLPGVRVATAATPFGPFIETGTGNIVTKQPNTWWSDLFEGQQFIEPLVGMFGKRVLACSNFNASYGQWGAWTINAFYNDVSDPITHNWQPSKLNPILQQLANNRFTAESFYYMVGSDWYVYYQSAPMIGQYGLQHWRLDGAKCPPNYWERILGVA